MSILFCSSSVSGSSGEMPLRLPKLRRNKSKQGGLGDADSGSVASVASLASNASSGSLRTVESELNHTCMQNNCISLLHFVVFFVCVCVCVCYLQNFAQCVLS